MGAGLPGDSAGGVVARLTLPLLRGACGSARQQERRSCKILFF